MTYTEIRQLIAKTKMHLKPYAKYAKLADYDVIDIHDVQYEDEFDETYIVCQAKVDLYSIEANIEAGEEMLPSIDPYKQPLYKGQCFDSKQHVNIKAGNYFLIAPEDGFVVDLGSTKEEAEHELLSIAGIADYE